MSDQREAAPISERLLRSAGCDLTPLRYPRGTPNVELSGPKAALSPEGPARTLG